MGLEEPLDTKRVGGTVFNKRGKKWLDDNKLVWADDWSVEEEVTENGGAKGF